MKSERKRTTAVGLVVGLMLMVPAGASADEANYQPYPLGERALGMGGAFAAMGGDPVSAYYNPAGLAFGRTTALSASLNVYGIAIRTIDNGGHYGWEWDVDEEGRRHPLLRDLEYSEFPPATIPTTVVIVRRVGPRFRDRSPRQAVAWSTLIPRASDWRYSFNISEDLDLDPATALDEHRFSLRETDKLMLIGPSYAFRITQTLSIGASFFCAIRTFSHSYRHTYFNPDSSPDVMGIWIEELDITSTVYSGAVRIGLQWEPAPGWRLGLMVAPPSFTIHGEGTYNSRSLETFYGAFELIENERVRANDQLPLEVRVGVAREAPSAYVVSLDVSVYGPATYDRFDLPLESDLYFVHRVRRRPIANVSAGAEVVLARRWPVRLGAFTDLSAAPEIAPGYEPTLPQIHAFGGTLSVGFRSRRFDINIGVLGYLGSGYAQRQGPMGPELPTFVATRAYDRRLYFFVSGAQRAVGRVLARWLDL